MAEDVTEKELLALYRDRLHDRAQSVTRRRRALESDPKPFSDLLGKFLGKDSEAMRRIEENRALVAWAQLVGETAARFSQALRVRQGTLTVHVADPMWMQQLSLLKQEILKKYRAQFPKLGIRDIYFTRR